MTTFTIETDNNITAHGTPEEAAATSATSFDIFASQKELTDLATGWPAERLGSHLEQPAGRYAGQEVQGSDDGRHSDLEEHSGAGRVSETEAGTAPAAETRTKGQRWRTGGQGRSYEGQGDQEGQDREERAPGQTGRQDAGSHRTARGQQDSPSGCHAPTQERSHSVRDHGKDGLAKAYRPRVHGRRDEEGWIHRRVFQAWGRRAHLPHQQVIANYSSS